MSIATRVGNVRKKMAEQQLDAVLVTSRENVFYLSGFSGSSGDLIITPENGYLLTDFRYLKQAQTESPDFILIDITKNFASHLEQIVGRHNIGLMGFEDRQVSYAAYNGMKQKMPRTTLRGIGNMLETLRICKEENELECMQKAAHIGDLAFEHIVSVMRPGMTEAEAAAEIEYAMKKNGAQRTSFDTIVAAGPNGAMPHAKPTDRPIAAGDLVVMDFGCVYQGYCSDMTRTVAVGAIDEKQRSVYNMVLYTQLKALNHIKAGMHLKDLDCLARETLDGLGYGAYFGHALGHGVGIEIHEKPSVSVKSADILRDGMVFSVEPGVYLNDAFGVRIEDTVMMVNGTPIIMNHAPKDLVVIGG